MSDDTQARIAELEAQLAALKAKDQTPTSQTIRADDSDGSNVREISNYGLYTEASTLAELSGGFQALLIPFSYRDSALTAVTK